MATDLPPIQKVSTIADSARWLAKADNVPGEIAHCLQLIQVISRDTKYLVELRDENYSTLQSTPREFNRINEIIESAAQSLADVDRLLEKYRAQAEDKGKRLSLPVIWLLSDSETFSLRARNLQTQHQTVLNEINHLRSYRMLNPVMQMAGKAELRQFENLDLIKSLMGGKASNKESIPKPNVQQRTTLSHQPKSMDYDVMGRPIQPYSHRGEKNAAQVPHCPEPILAELPSNPIVRPSFHPHGSSFLSPNAHQNESRISISSDTQADSSQLGRAHSQESDSRGGSSQVPDTPPAAQMATGLMALFRKPIRLGEKPPSAPPRQSFSVKSIETAEIPPQRSSVGSALPPTLSSMPSSVSLMSHHSDPSGTQKLDSQATFEMHNPSYIRPRTQSFGPGPPRSSAPEVAQGGPIRTHHRGPSQLFVYRPRSSAAPPSLDRASLISENPIYELDGSSTPSQVSLATSGVQPTYPPSNDYRQHQSHSSRSGSEAQSSQSSPPMLSPPSVHGAPVVGRDRADSAAWRRRTELFQAREHD
ncbi:hypothetical protein SUNI508_10943 [Seiridium unicorne]|uniref:Uncharacterized protein n=1 Tax=Seiridium unicorne TaxID=138068 RepID=A0ABR2UJJ6_9PEZI